MAEISRRTVLRGLGAAMALPWLEAMAPRAVGAAAGVVAAPKPPVRLGFAYVPNGVNWRKWHVDGEEKRFDLSPSLQPLADLRSEVLFFRNLALDQGRDHGDGGGDHPRATSSFLTAAHAFKNFGKDVRVGGISVDQFAAQRIGRHTRLPSLELACERPQPPAMCDAGYSGVYRNAVSWRTPTSPVPTEMNPRLVFLRLFGDPARGGNVGDRAKLSARQAGILDLVAEDAKALDAKVGGADRLKLEEYLHSVRAVEQQIQAAERIPARPPPPGTPVPDGVPAETADHIRLMCDLTALAFRTDSTRIASVMFSMGGSDRAFPFLGLNTTHHSLSHHEMKPDNLEGLHRIDRFYVEMFAHLVGRLKSVKEGDGTLLDNCLILYGSPLRDGNKHDRGDLPILLAGRGGGAVSPGRLLKPTGETPLANIYLSMLDAAGVPDVAKFSDSTGRMTGLKG